jgi:hypothetical protein
LLAYEASLNPLGIPAHIARDPNRRFGLDEVVDQSMAVLEEAQDEYAAPGGQKQHGLRLVVIDEGPIPGVGRGAQDA